MSLSAIAAAGPASVLANDPTRRPLLADFQGRHRGETIVVCGCGESLRGFQPPAGLVTIGVNDVGRQFTPNYLVVVNPPGQFRGDRFHHVRSSAARFIFTQLELGLRRDNVVRFQLGRRGGTETSNPNVLHYTQNSPYVAVNLAAHLGATRIGLLGVDFTDGHFFGDKGPHPLSHQLQRIDAEYGALRHALQSRGIELINLSPMSRLTTLPHVSLPEFLAPLDTTSVLPAGLKAPTPKSAPARVFFVNYRFLACGDVFSAGLAHAAEELGVTHAAAGWDDPGLPAKIRTFAPDLVFVVHGRRCAQRWASVLREWKSAVWLLDEPYEVDDTARWSSVFGTVFVNDPATLARHRNAHYLPTGFDSRIHFDPGGERRHRVGFIGGHNPVRECLLLQLAEQELLSYVVGGPWKAPALRKLCLAGNCAPTETARLYQNTRIVLNIFRSVHHFNRERTVATTLNPRIFEALACGALVVSEPRPELAACFPELPTFGDESSLQSTVRGLLEEPARADTLLQASRARLVGHDYSHRLAKVLEIALAGPATSRRPSSPAPCSQASALPVEGWRIRGAGVAGMADGEVRLMGGESGETGLASDQSWGALRLSFEVLLDARCHFIAKIHHAIQGDPAADSYHLVATPERSYMARHHKLLAPLSLARERWQKVELGWIAGALTVAINGREVCRCADATLSAGFCFLGVTEGSASLRSFRIEVPAAEPALPVVPGWTRQGTGIIAGDLTHLMLSTEAGGPVALVSDLSLNDVELSFSVRLEAGAHFFAKIHHQAPEDSSANSYHLISTPAQGFVARHNHVFAPVRLGRRGWQRVRLRWVDQRLELFVNGQSVARAADNLLQSGCCVVGVAAGQAELRGLTVRDVSAASAPRVRSLPTTSSRSHRPPLPFTRMPRRNLIYHVWPVRGEMWRWNIAQLCARLDLFNGRRIVGIVHDERSEDPDEVRKALDGHGCEFVIARNGPMGEGLTFPSLLSRVRSLDPDEVTFYGHAKGVKYEPAIPDPVRRWSETQYRAALDHWPSVRSQLERFALTGSFRMLGRFKAHHYAGDWHYSGTFFWLRHVSVFGRDLGALPGFYGCVEAWPGMHFGRDETGCLFMDGLRQLPYHPEFWKVSGNAAFARWEASHSPPVPPPDLVRPAAFEGYTVPRLEQHPEEFAWLLDEFVAAAPRRVLTIGSMHGGVEWHLARRFRALGRDLEITAVDLGARPELLTTFDDIRHRFGQSVELVVGDSAAAQTRERLASQYDAVFIDGDHGYRGARADVDFALSRSPRLIALHDIADSDWHAQAGCCVSRVWEELRAEYATDERITGVWGGIGRVRL